LESLAGAVDADFAKTGRVNTFAREFAWLFSRFPEVLIG